MSEAHNHRSIDRSNAASLILLAGFLRTVRLAFTMADAEVNTS